MRPRLALVSLVTAVVVALGYSLVLQVTSGQPLSPGVQISFWVAIFTLVIDLVDLRTQIGSFGFVLSLNYGAYYLLRLILGGLAATIIGTSGEMRDPFALGFVAVLAGFTVLQNFAVSFGGQDIVDVSTLFEGYRLAMITDEGKRIARQEMARTIALANELVRTLNTGRLKNELTTMISVTAGAQQAQSRVGELEELCGSNEQLLQRALAAEMVQLNADYIRAYKDAWLAETAAS